MRICENEITGIIRDLFGANPLKIPESRIQPMCLLEIEDNRPIYLGEFKSMVKGDFDHLIEVKSSVVSEISNVKSEKVSFGFGIKILGNFLKAFKMDPVVTSLALKNSKKMSFSFSDVQRKYIEPLEFGKVLSENSIFGNPNNIFIEGILKNDNLKLALITDVLVSNNFSLSTYTESDSEAKIDIPMIQGYVANVGLDLKVNSTSENEVKFKREEFLTFAFSCVEIRIDPVTGKFSKGDWLKKIRSARGLETIDESQINDEDLNKSARFMIDDNSANPLLLEF